jgi:hypothetical protein
MKRALTGIIALFTLFLVVSCEDETITRKACGLEDPATNLSWLADIISKADNDQTGNFIGTIWIKEYQGQDYIITDMALESGGLKFHCFDCKGDLNPIVDIEFYNSLTDKEVVFSNME